MNRYFKNVCIGNISNIIKRQPNNLLTNTRSFAVGSRSRSRSGGLRKTKTAPPPAVTPELAWKPVLDQPSGLYYYWNTITDETTHVGAENPALAYSQSGSGNAVANQSQQQQGGGMMSGLGGVVAQGMAFGVGSSIAHHAVGSIMGGMGGGSDSGGSSGSDMGGEQDYSNQSPMDDGGGGDFSDDFDI